MKLILSALTVLTFSLFGGSSMAQSSGQWQDARCSVKSLATTPQPIQVVKIGQADPLSGAIAHLGLDNLYGAMLAIEGLNQKNIRIQDKCIRFELVAINDAADPKQAQVVAQRLVDAGVVAVVGHLNSGTSIPASKIYDMAGVVQVAPSPTNPFLTEQGFGRLYRLILNDRFLSGTLADYVHGHSKVTKILLIDDQTAYGEYITSGFKNHLERINPKVVIKRIPTVDKATDFPEVMASLKQDPPDWIVFGGMDLVAGALIQQMAEFGLHTPLIGGDGICTSYMAEKIVKSRSKSRVVCAEAGGVPDGLLPPMKAFQERFKNRFGDEIRVYAPYVYDGFFLIANAMVAANSTQVADFNRTLRSEVYDGLGGRYRFDTRGDNVTGYITFYDYTAGKRQQFDVRGVPPSMLQ